MGHSPTFRLGLPPRLRYSACLAPALLVPVVRVFALAAGFAAAVAALSILAVAVATAFGIISAFAIAIDGAARGGGLAQGGLPVVTRVVSVCM